MTEKGIQIAVVKADLIVCAILRWLAVIVPLTIVLIIAVIAFRKITHLDNYDPYLIDYDKPGVDITSKGHLAYTEEYYRRRNKEDG